MKAIKNNQNCESLGPLHFQKRTTELLKLKTELKIRKRTSFTITLNLNSLFMEK